ncbi:Zinc finger protein [Plecturocebus cupreus]
MLECSGAIIVHCSLELLSSSDPFASASKSAGTTGMSHHARLDFHYDVKSWSTVALLWLTAALSSQAQALLLLQPPKVVGITDEGSHYVAQAGLELLGSSNPLSLASQPAGIAGMSHSILDLTLSLTLECSGMITAHCSLNLLG